MDTLLLIDDTDTLDTVLGVHLRNAGHEVIVAATTVVAYETFIRREIGVVVIRYGFCEQGVQRFIRTFRDCDDREDLPIAVFTPREDEEMRAECEGADLVIHAGDEPDRIRASLESLICAHHEEFKGHSIDNEMGNSIVKATADVFRTMAHLDATPLEIAVEKARSRRAEVIGSLGIAGCLSGSISLFLDRELALRAASGMLMIDDVSELTDEDVIDAIGEVTNMIGGSIKTELFRKVPLFDVSVPSVYLGKDLQRCTVSDDLCFYVPFEVDGCEMSVELLMIRSESSTTTGVQGAVISAMPG